MHVLLRAFAVSLLLISAMALRAEAQVAPPPAAGPVYVVTYIDGSLDAVPLVTAVLRTYRDASRKEPANMGVQIYHDVGQANRFLVTEAWREQADYATHLKAASSRQLDFNLKPAVNGPIDTRVHRAFSVGAPPANAAAAAPPDGSVLVMSHLDVAPPLFASLQPALPPYVNGSRREKGMVRFDVLQHVDPRQNHLTVLEAWSSNAAMEAHRAAAHTKAFRAKLHPILGALYDERVYRPIK
jgi:quinol monooxygenase YgiN